MACRSERNLHERVGACVLFALLLIFGILRGCTNDSFGAFTWCVLGCIHMLTPHPSVLAADDRNTIIEFDPRTVDDIDACMSTQSAKLSYWFNDVLMVFMALLNGIFFLTNLLTLPPVDFGAPSNFGQHLIAWYEFPIWMYYVLAGMRQFFEAPGWKNDFRGLDVTPEENLLPGGAQVTDDDHIHEGHRLAAASYYFTKSATFSSLALLRWMQPSYIYAFGKSRSSGDKFFKWKMLCRVPVAVFLGLTALRQKLVNVAFIKDHHVFNLFKFFGGKGVERLSLYEIVQVLGFTNNILNIFNLYWIRIEMTLRAGIELKCPGQEHQRLYSTWFHEHAKFLWDNIDRSSGRLAGLGRGLRVLERLLGMDHKEALSRVAKTEFRANPLSRAGTASGPQGQVRT
eukprot:TRINITY_DN92203_c0_g1_i1.p1 TRINITY_DN92203_c0_g1~~TRINITY_DN92203_c0_g1_i1.p1  ORF type:complete len:399 (-),score=57.26 TRINITY_DN92203_c0_g1_i1:34-1230(-)